MTFSGIKKLGGPTAIGGRIVKEGADSKVLSKMSGRSSADKLPTLGRKRQSVEKTNNKKLNVSIDISSMGLTTTLFMKQEKQFREKAMENGVPKRYRGIQLTQMDPVSKMSRSALAA